MTSAWALNMTRRVDYDARPHGVSSRPGAWHYVADEAPTEDERAVLNARSRFEFRAVCGRRLTISLGDWRDELPVGARHVCRRCWRLAGARRGTVGVQRADEDGGEAS